MFVSDCNREEAAVIGGSHPSKLSLLMLEEEKKDSPHFQVPLVLIKRRHGLSSILLND